MTNTLQDYTALAKRIYNTEDGMRYLAYLKMRYIDTTCIGATNDLTLYNLGKKELVQGLISTVEKPEELYSHIKAINNITNEREDI